MLTGADGWYSNMYIYFLHDQYTKMRWKMYLRRNENIWLSQFCGSGRVRVLWKDPANHVYYKCGQKRQRFWNSDSFSMNELKFVVGENVYVIFMSSAFYTIFKFVSQDKNLVCIAFFFSYKSFSTSYTILYY